MKCRVEESVGISIAQTYIYHRCLLLSLMVRLLSSMSRLLTFIFFPLSSFSCLLPYAPTTLDEMTAQYLSTVLPNGSQLDVNKIKVALEDTRQQTPLSTSKLETRIAEAVASLGIR